MAMPVEALARCVQDNELLSAVTFIKVDIAPSSAARNDVIKRRGNLNAQGYGYENTFEIDKKYKENRVLVIR